MRRTGRLRDPMPPQSGERDKGDSAADLLIYYVTEGRGTVLPAFAAALRRML